MKKLVPLNVILACLVLACQTRPLEWEGSILAPNREHITVEELLSGTPQPLVDMSYFAQPDWGKQSLDSFSGTIAFQEAQLTFPKSKAYYPGENFFPRFEVDFISSDGALVPRIKDKIMTRHQSSSLWDVVVGTGKVWSEAGDEGWSRASFPFTLTDRYVGQARNCVGTFVYQADTISHLCLQCSQETADIDDQQLGNISGMVPITFQAQNFVDADQIVEQHNQAEANRLAVHLLSDIDVRQDVADYFDKMIYTNAPTSLGAVMVDGKLYLHPPKTRHGLYPYPSEMRHGLYSVTKSMAGALALMYFEERYEENVFDLRITDYVPALADHPGWQEVTFGHTLNMVTGNVGSESLDHFYGTVIVAETAEEAIQNIATLGDAPPKPGERFNYASANYFVLSYALQQYVEAKEGIPNYWELVHEHVLVPIGAEHFSVLHTLEAGSDAGIPILALGALPTLDEAAKIALLFANEGQHEGQQLLNKKRVQEAFGKSDWEGHNTHRDARGDTYQHGFWAKEVKASSCRFTATYMLGFGENYIVFLPGNTLIFRFLDEHDLNIDKLIKRVERISPAC